MKSLDIIDSASFGYMTVWAERRYLAKLAIIPVLITLACAVVIYALGYETNFLRQGLINLPAFFAEGWLLAQFLRTLLLQERWPIYLYEEPTDQQMSALLLRARGIMSATIMYALIGMVTYAVNQVFFQFYIRVAEMEKAAESGEAAAPNPWMFLPALAVIYILIWLFRLLWLYIPVVVLMPVRDFLAQTKGFPVLLRMLAIFLICMLPCFLAADIFAKILSSVAGGSDTAQGRFIIIIIAGIVGVIAKLIATAAMAYAFRHILPRHPNALPDLER